MSEFQRKCGQVIRAAEKCFRRGMSSEAFRKKVDRAITKLFTTPSEMRAFAASETARNIATLLRELESANREVTLLLDGELAEKLDKVARAKGVSLTDCILQVLAAKMAGYTRTDKD